MGPERQTEQDAEVEVTAGQDDESGIAIAGFYPVGGDRPGGLLRYPMGPPDSGFRNRGARKPG